MKYLSLLLLLLVLTTSAPLSAWEEFVPLQRYVSLASGPISGHYFPLALGIARLLNRQGVPDTAIALPTAGSAENIALLRHGDVRYAFCQADVFAWAIRGEGIFDGDPVRNLRSVASLYDETVHLVVRADSDIRGLDELRGARLALGAPGSGSRSTGQWILEQFALTPADYQGSDDNFETGLEALVEKRLDAVLLVSALPNDALRAAASRQALRLLPLPAPKKLAQSPLQVCDIPADSYPGQEIPVPTLSLAAMLVTLAETPADEVEQHLRQILAALPSLPLPSAARRPDVFAGIPEDFLHEGARRVRRSR